MTQPAHLAGEQRLDQLQDLLRKHGAVRLAEAADQLGVSEMTVRRDLAELEELGVARRVRGGAVAVGAAPEPFADRQRAHARAKARIAAKLQPLVPRTGAIGVDASTTLQRMVRGIDGAQDLLVVTNGPESFAALADLAGVRPLLTGGELDRRTGSLVGPVAVRAAGEFMLSRLFLSSAGVDPARGTGEACLEEAEVKRALAASAAEVVVAVDASKLDARGSVLGLGWDQVSLLVTDLDPGHRRLDPYREAVALL